MIRFSPPAWAGEGVAGRETGPFVFPRGARRGQSKLEVTIVRTFLGMLIAAMAAALVAGCAVAPAYGPYGYAYGYDNPYYYGDSGPYYGYGPGYYYDYGSPGIFGAFRFDHRDRDRRWDRHWRDDRGSWHNEGGGSWQHNSLRPGGDRTTTHMRLSGHRMTGNRPASRSTSERRASTSRRAQSSRSREDRSDRG